MVNMEQEHDWIEQEKGYFGQEGHMYSFREFNAGKAGDDLKKLKMRVEEGKKRVNFKVDSMFDDQNERYE